jgi:hypothetical protein
MYAFNKYLNLMDTTADLSVSSATVSSLTVTSTNQTSRRLASPKQRSRRPYFIKSKFKKAQDFTFTPAGSQKYPMDLTVDGNHDDIGTPPPRARHKMTMDKVGDAQQPPCLPGPPVFVSVADEDDDDASPYDAPQRSLFGKRTRRAIFSTATVSNLPGLPVALGTPVMGATSVYSSSPPVYTTSASLPGLSAYGVVAEDA